MKFLDRIPSWLSSKYLIALVAFATWMFFFDDRDVVTTHIRHPHELKTLQQSKQYYEDQIILTRKELDQLKLNAATIEKYAREKYFMKKDNEDLFIFQAQ
jgi:cell division protein DivIC